MRKIFAIEISVAVGLIVSLIFSVFSFGADCNNIRDNIVRLHILANSDSEKDQAVKLDVRDELLRSGSELFGGSVTPDIAQAVLENKKDELIAVANKTLKEKGFEYEAKVYFVKEYFATRSYENFTLPAGEYSAVKVVLGDGEGKNWWCVMFPPLCLPAAVKNEPVDIYIGKNGAEIVNNYPEYEVRFKIIEVYEGIKNRFKHIID